MFDEVHNYLLLTGCNRSVRPHLEALLARWNNTCQTWTTPVSAYTELQINPNPILLSQRSESQKGLTIPLFSSSNSAFSWFLSYFFCCPCSLVCFEPCKVSGLLLFPTQQRAPALSKRTRGNKLALRLISTHYPSERSGKEMPMDIDRTSQSPE